MNITETVAEAIRELSEMLPELPPHSLVTREGAARILERVSEELAEAAQELRQP
jgi:hypothetical protein